jgi:hypothetical protein
MIDLSLGVQGFFKNYIKKNANTSVLLITMQKQGQHTRLFYLLINLALKTFLQGISSFKAYYTAWPKHKSTGQSGQSNKLTSHIKMVSTVESEFFFFLSTLNYWLH